MFSEKIVAYLELVKIFSSSKSTLYYGFCSFVGTLLGASRLFQIVNALAAATAITFSTFAIYALNDIYDVQIDAINDNKRPIPSGRVTTREAKIIATAFFIAGATIATTINVSVFLCTILFSLLGIAYSVPPLRFKNGVFANVCWGVGISAAILCGASVATISNSSIIAAFTLAFLTAGCGLTKDLKDLEGDRAMKICTLPVKLGEKPAIKLMTIASIAGFLLLFLSLLLINANIVALVITTITAILFAFSLLVLYRNPLSKITYNRAYKLQAWAGFLIILAFMATELI